MIARRLAWPLLSMAAAAAAGTLTRVLVNRLWKAATGAEIPPEREESSVSMGEAVAWAAGIGAAAGVARVVSRRTAAALWEKSTGDLPPGETKSP